MLENVLIVYSASIAFIITNELKLDGDIKENFIENLTNEIRENGYFSCIFADEIMYEIDEELVKIFNK